jgi:hypothetical protein
MIQTKTTQKKRAAKKRYYQVFNLTVSSTLPLPELVGAASQPADISILEGRAPKRLPAAGVKNEAWLYDDHLYYQVGDDQVLLDVKEAGRFWIKNRNTIIIQRRKGVSDDEVRLYLLGSCFGFMLLSRGLFAFHGSAVADGDKCLMFIGESGAGKSTTAAAFLQKGYQMLADDVSLVDFDDHNRAMVYPAFPQIKLWEDSARALSLENSSLKLILPDWEKLKVATPSGFTDIALPLTDIFEICPSSDSTLRVHPLEGIEKFKALSSNIYRGAVIKELDRIQSHFAFCSHLAKQTRVFRIERPAGRFQLDELVRQVEDCLNLPKDNPRADEA